MSWQRVAWWVAGVGTVLVTGAQILFNNDPDALRERWCFVRANTFSPCTPSAPTPTGPIVFEESNKAPKATEGENVAGSLTVESPVRPAIELTSSLEIELSGSNFSMVHVLVRAKITNTGKQPIEVAWDDIGRNARVYLPLANELRPSMASARQPSGVVNCRNDASWCWQQYRNQFSKLLPGDFVVGTMTFSKQVPTANVESIRQSATYAFSGKLAYGYREMAAPEVMSISLEDLRFARPPA